MKVVAIGDRSEYGSRLVRFLESHLPRDIHIVRYTDSNQFSKQVSKEAYCIITKDFAQELAEIKQYTHCIFLGEQENEQTFCRYHSPTVLVEKITQHFEREPVFEVKDEKNVVLVAVYAPIYLSGLGQIALRHMPEGSLCIGMEDLGYARGPMQNMSELCYYIRLRKEDITKQIQQMMEIREGRYFIESPRMYYDLSDLSEEDYLWFFSKVREMSGYRTIYVLLGSSAVRNIHIFQNFDQIIMVNQRSHKKLNQFWDNFQEVLATYQIEPERGLSMIYREEIL